MDIQYSIVKELYSFVSNCVCLVYVPGVSLCLPGIILFKYFILQIIENTN